MTDITAEQISMVIDSVLSQLGAIPLAALEAQHAETKKSLDDFMNIGHLLNPVKLHDGSYDDAEHQYNIVDALIDAMKAGTSRSDEIDGMEERTIQFTLRNALRVLGMIPVAAYEQYIAEAEALHNRIRSRTLDGMLPGNITEADIDALALYYPRGSKREVAVAALLRALKLAHERDAHAAGIRVLRQKMGW